MNYFHNQKSNRPSAQKTGGFLFSIAAALLLTGCAEIIHKRVEQGMDNDKGDGLRYYNSSPYVLIYSNGKGGVVTQLLYIADPFKKMMATPKSKMAKLKTELNFKDGVFTSSKDELDGMAVPEAIGKAIETAAPAFQAALNAPSQKELSAPAPYLYKVIVNGNEVSFVGGQGDTPIQVSLLKQEPPKK